MSNANQANKNEAENPVVAARKKLADLQRVYFPSEKMADAEEFVTEISALCEIVKVPLVFSFKVEDGVPENFGLVIVPVNKRKKGGTGNETIGVAVGVIPEMAAITAHENGEAYILETITDSLVTKFANTVRPRGDETEIDAFGLPFDVADFIISQRAGGMLGGFNELANDFVTALKRKKIPFLTKATLRQILSCSAFAEQHYPTIKQAAWVAVVNQMAKVAEARDLETGIFTQWLETRDDAELPTADVDLSDLDIDMGGDDEASEAIEPTEGDVIEAEATEGGKAQA